MSKVSKIAYPEWTEYRKKNGLDPLGMQTSSIGLYQTLLPGISNVTLRVRYYGFYAWLCRVYAREIGDTNPRTWQRIVRRAEALYALVAQRHGNEGGVAGIQWAARTLEAPVADEIDFATDAEPGSETFYLKQAWGAYGAAYASQLYEIGLFGKVEGHEIPVPGPEIGEPMADAFEAALGPLAEQFFSIVQRGRVSLNELDELSPTAPSGTMKAGAAICSLARQQARTGGGVRRPALTMVCSSPAFIQSLLIRAIRCTCTSRCRRLACWRPPMEASPGRGAIAAC